MDGDTFPSLPPSLFPECLVVSPILEVELYAIAVEDKPLKPCANLLEQVIRHVFTLRGLLGTGYKQASFLLHCVDRCPIIINFKMAEGSEKAGTLFYLFLLQFSASSLEDIKLFS